VPAKKAETGCAFWIVAALAVLFFVSTVLLLLALVGVAVGKGGLEARGGPAEEQLVEQTVQGEGTNKILLIPINGVIADLPDEGLFGGGPGLITTVRDALRAARKDEEVKAVLLEIDSPGGGITASDVVYHELQEFHQDTKKDIVSLLGDVAASGGYYVAAASQRIVAHPTTVTGSIGVLIPLVGIEGLLDKVGVKVRPIKSGPMKDVGAMSREMTPEERAMLQTIVNEYYERFVTVVHNGMKGRNVAITLEKLKGYCDGRVFTGEQAKQIGFVDEIGYFKDAVRAACDRAGIKPGEARVITYHRKPGLLETILSRSSAPRTDALTIRLEGLTGRDTPRMMYLWTVGQPALNTAAPGN